ncbi:MAG: bifunctional (p)ppGpp synthetase/guanosine-3',5'-bis(diphosphate) 3'-pyrophosphohydrolase, partial [Rhodospirillaceae bacterium]|nr:bifunctional (p)ppGpp synthetase/guanosine-3',5'-bis(diphosphate) 3'-pyrophosphohydrolase [Rhodospirillaceae bacterium]
WKKMQIQDVSFEQLSDIMAFRIMVDDNADCYRALGIVHAAYRTVPGRIKDHISTPKRNGYQSIHTSIIGPEKHRIEVQIRTKSMHEIAELGVAAHWQYKQGLGDVAGSQYSWLRELLDILEHAQTPEEFLEHTKLEMFQDQVFCFTPKGELITLPKGASPVDFAYAVHTEVGNTCVGAKVNGRIVPLRIELHTGDQVEIAVSKAQKPSPEWEGFVITGKARAHIRRRVRMEAHEEYAKLGKEILSKMFVKEAYDLTDDGLNEAAEKLDYHDRTDVYAAVGEGQVMARQVLEAVYPGVKTSPQTKVVNISKARRQNAGAAESAVPIKGLTPGLALHLSECCHPLPGDRIVGILKAGKGVDVHTIDCESLIELAEEPENWLDIVWDNKKTGDMLLGRVNLTVLNEPGSLGALSTVIAQNQGNISNLKIVGRSNDFFEMDLDIEVTSVKHLTNIIAALRASPAINSVERARG